MSEDVVGDYLRAVRAVSGAVTRYKRFILCDTLVPLDTDLLDLHDPFEPTEREYLERCA